MRVAIVVLLAAGLAIFSLACNQEEPVAVEPAAAEPAAEPAAAEPAAEPAAAEPAAAEPAAAEAAAEPAGAEPAAADDGKRRLEGTAQNAKMGAVLVTAEGNIWIELDAWPDELVGKKLAVEGRMVTKSDVPVVEPAAGEPAAAGVPVEEGQDAAQAAMREVLSEATWTVMD